MRLDHLVEREAEQGGRKERHEQVQREALRGGIVEEAAQDRGKSRAEFPADRQDGSGLDHDLEGLRLFARVAGQRAGHDQVARGGDGQEFGEAFDNAEKNRGNERGLFQDGRQQKNKAGSGTPGP